MKEIPVGYRITENDGVVVDTLCLSLYEMCAQHK